jgi:hypothetical protein
MASTTRTVDLSRGAFKGRLVAFTDRSRMGSNPYGDSTLMRIPFANGADVYLIYNRKKSFNDGVREGGDMLMISQTIANDPIESNRLAMLDSEQQYAIPGSSIVVRACRKTSSAGVDRMVVSVFDTSRGQGSICSTRIPLTTRPK